MDIMKPSVDRLSQWLITVKFKPSSQKYRFGLGIDLWYNSLNKKADGFIYLRGVHHYCLNQDSQDLRIYRRL